MVKHQKLHHRINILHVLHPQILVREIKQVKLLHTIHNFNNQIRFKTLNHSLCSINVSQEL